MCVGDFNEIMVDDEKVGGALRSTNQMESFRKMIEDCSFMDVPCTGPKFSWSRGKEDKMILKRLDRGLATEALFGLFPILNEKHLQAIYSDHVPLLFSIANQQPDERYRK